MCKAVIQCSTTLPSSGHCCVINSLSNTIYWPILWKIIGDPAIGQQFTHFSVVIHMARVNSAFSSLLPFTQQMFLFMSKNEVHKCKIYSYSFSYCIVMILIKLLARNWYDTLLTIAIFHSKAGSLWLYNLKSYRLPCYSRELILSLTDLGEY